MTTTTLHRKSDESRTLETARQPSATKRKQDKGTMPAVTWIDMQPESSSRTSLKSLTDYLTETQDDAPVFTPSNRLRLSPETLDALDNAEKLVDDVERQLSQMRFDDSLTDDTEDDGLDGIKLNDERLHAHNIVKSVFQRGYYEPAPRPVFSKDNWKHTRDNLSQAKSSKVLSIPIARRVAPVPVDECLLCKSNKADESAKQLAVDGQKATETSAGHVDKSEKLNVQKGPAISIKGPLAVQTAKIVDIQPTQQIPAKRVENIVTYECRHLDMSDEMPGASIIDANQLEQDRLEIRADQRKSINKSALNYSRKSDDNDKSIAHKGARFWHACEDEELDLDDFTLREPAILEQVDVVLQQQRNIIRQVHAATRSFDQFIAESTPVESFDASLEEIDRFERLLANKQTSPRECSEPKKVSSEIDDERAKSNKIDTRYEKSLSISSESLKLMKSASVSIRIINEDRAVESNKRSSSSTVVSEASNRIFQDSSKRDLTVTNKSSVGQSKDTQYSENFESESSGGGSKFGKSQSLKLESGTHTDGEISSNSFAQSSVHTRTKSNAGLIENLESLSSLKEPNLLVSLRQKADVSQNDVSTSIGNDNVDKSLRVNRELSESIRRKCGSRSSLSANKPDRLHISETDDERELHSYEFDIDLLEGENEQAKVTNKKIDGKKDKSTEKLQDNLDKNSQKTSHLIDSISDISFHGSSERTKSTQASQQISFASNNSKAELAKVKENTVEEAANELSTESKIEMKLSEARDNLKILMKTMNVSVDSGADDEPEKVNVVDQEPCKIIEVDEQQSADNDVPRIMKNITLRPNDARRQDSRASNSTNVINQECNDVPNDRSFMAILQRNSDAFQNSLEHQKLLLLQNLESCSIQTPKRGKRLFTSTIVDDACPPANFTRSRESSTIRQDASSDSHSEGEIRLSSTASHSLGEIRRSISENKSNGSAKESTTASSVNLNDNSSPPSAGEIDELNKN